VIDSTEKINFAVLAVELWRGNTNSLQHIGDSSNCIFSFIQSGKKKYLRLTPPFWRTKNQIEAELEFVLYLRQAGADAMPPDASVNGRLVEEINFTGNSVFACVFEEAEGARFRYDSAKFPEEHFKLRGRTLGQIHALSKTYVPSAGFRRFSWDEDKLLVETDKFLPKSERIVWSEYEKLKECLRNYPKFGETFGLIHGDFGETNYRHRNDRLNVFDFDDCCYHWFVYDIAVTIYPHGWRKEGLRLLDCILEGYSEKINLSLALADITMFCQWRLIYMFLVYAKKWGFENLSEQQARWFKQTRENIARGYKWQI
jgi:Ser/Thr protein kinase RdoA (MazF antagonist)